MNRKLLPTAVLILFLLVSACTPVATTLPAVIPTDTTAHLPQATTVAPSQAVPTITLAPTDTTAPTNTVQVPTIAPPPSPSGTAVSDPAATNYVDDRSTPSQVIVSLYNAINRKEYARAYGYYTNPTTTPGNYNDFANGYANTNSVSLTFGQITGDSGAGQTYYSVPVILHATQSGGTQVNYAACYIVHQANPGFFGAPPFQPMGIDRGQASIITAGTSDSTALTGACNGLPTGANPVAAGAESLSIDKTNFIDNRSGAIETVSSLLNAINLKQYVRAYSYFETPSTFPGPYTAYEAGFANTDTITATFGTASSEGAAGSIYYKVPLAEKVLTTASGTQTFVGCYTLRLSQPGNYSTPPVPPLAIQNGTFTQVANDADVNTLLASACQ